MDVVGGRATAPILTPVQNLHDVDLPQWLHKLSHSLQSQCGVNSHWVNMSSGVKFAFLLVV